MDIVPNNPLLMSKINALNSGLVDSHMVGKNFEEVKSEINEESLLGGAKFDLGISEIIENNDV